MKDMEGEEREENTAENQLVNISGEEASSGGREMAGSHTPKDEAASSTMTSCWQVTPAQMEKFHGARPAIGWEYDPLHSTGCREVQEFRQELAQLKELLHSLLLRDDSNPGKHKATPGLPATSPSPQVTTPGLSAAAPSSQQERPEGEGGKAQPQYREEMELRATFDGDPEKLPIFLFRVATFMTKWADTFANEMDKVQYVVDHLEGAAAEWFMALYDTNAPELNNLDAFMLALKSRFEDRLRKVRARAKLMNLKQGSCSVQEYALEFRRLASLLPEWNEAFRIHVFKEGLRPDLLEWVLARDMPDTLMGWVDLASKGEMVKEEIKIFRQKQPWLPRSRGKKDDNPPRSRDRLDPRAKEQRWKLDLCLHCGGEGHLAVACPESERKPAGCKPEESQQKGSLCKGRKTKATALASKQQRQPKARHAGPKDDASDSEQLSGNETCLDW
ncbi:retrotransposon-derived protein PEG10 isoform X4 [Anolis carolinensis]